MNYIYLITPKNPNLNHSPDTFEAAITAECGRNSIVIDRSHRLNFKSSLALIQKLKILSPKDKILVFLFSTQPEYIPAIIALRCWGALSKRKIGVYQQMHEPKYEKGRATLKMSLLVYWINFILSRLCDRIILSSKQAEQKAQDFIPKDKIVRINLTFLNNDREVLEKNITELKQSWDRLKTVSSFGIGAKDKNIEGFLSLANIVNAKYSGQIRCIRAGWDKDIKLDYSKEQIVHFSGYIPNSAKKLLLSLTHVIVIPYQFSTQSGVVIEALSNGKIVIANDITAFSHLKSLKSVFIIDFNDRQQIVGCLERLMTMTPSEYEECCWDSINYFNANHSTKYLQERLDELLV
jgi:glycosyltransferase involved in cell wall biosynthesis